MIISKQQLIDSFVHDCNVIKHLATKVTPELLDYRPHAGMRTTLELLQYLSHVATGSLRGIVLEVWDWEKRQSEASKVNLQNFAQAMDAQIEEIRSILSDADEKDLQTKVVHFPWGGSTVVGIGLIDSGLKFLTSYKLQLFLYLRMNGIAVSTPNVWRGADPAPAKG
jgi:hypothetical protein